MDEAGHLAVAIEGGHPLLEAPYEEHPAVHPDESGSWEGRR
jgi:hypothetical protein